MLTCHHHKVTCFAAINTKTAVAKWQKPATAAAAGKQQANILYMQFMSSGVQQTAVQKDGCESRAHYFQCAE